MRELFCPSFVNSKMRSNPITVLVGFVIGANQALVQPYPEPISKIFKPFLTLINEA